MAFGLASGHPAYSGTWIPEIWEGKLLEKFYKSTFWSQISNTQYEGKIKDQGDKVYIRQVPDMNISNYVKGQNLTLQKPTSTNVELLIDKGKYFAFTLDDVDKVQFDIDAMDAWSDDASEQLKISIDSDVLNNIYSSVSSSNAGITAGAISSSFNLGTTAASIALDKTNIIDYILDCGTVLDESNIPETGRWMVITNWMANLISKSDQVMVRYSRN